MTANIGNEEISQHALELRESAKDLSEGKLAKKSDIAEGKDEHHNSGMEFRFITESTAKGGMGISRSIPQCIILDFSATIRQWQHMSC